MGGGSDHKGPWSSAVRKGDTEPLDTEKQRKQKETPKVGAGDSERAERHRYVGLAGVS